MTPPLSNLLRSISAAQRDGRTAAACIIASARGSTPQPAGALMFLDDTGRIHGTIGGGCLEAEVRRRAMALLAEGGSALFRFKLDHDYGWDDGLICGGTVELAIAPAPVPERLDEIAAGIDRGLPGRLEVEVESEAGRQRIALNIPARSRLCIAGAGHIGLAVARHAVALDFDITIFDDRPDLLARAPKSARTVCGPIAEHFAGADIDQNTCCLIVTRGHRHDQQALAAILQQAVMPRYVGMIGSRRKVKLTFDELASRGIPRERLAAVHAPVGLPIGAQTVEEIAVSIAAQLVQVRAAGAAPGPAIERTVLPSADAGDRRPIGVILAAGRGQRMGCTKQLLPLPGDPENRALVAAAFDAIAPACSSMVVVVAHDAEAVLQALHNRSFTTVQAPRCSAMSESLRAGLRAAVSLDRQAAVLLHLADHPHIAPETLSDILRAGRDNPGHAIRPTCPADNGRGGHPILIPPGLIDKILGDSLEQGLRAWWRDHPQACLDLPLNDCSIVTDVDTPDDYLCLSNRGRGAACRTDDHT